MDRRDVLKRGAVAGFPGSGRALSPPTGGRSSIIGIPFGALLSLAAGK